MVTFKYGGSCAHAVAQNHAVFTANIPVGAVQNFNPTIHVIRVAVDSPQVLCSCVSSGFGQVNWLDSGRVFVIDVHKDVGIVVVGIGGAFVFVLNCPNVNLFAFGIAIAVVVFVVNYLSTVGVLVVDHLAIDKAYKVNCVQVPVFFAVVAVLAVNFVFAVLSVFAFLYNVPIVVVNVVLFRCGDCFRP